MDGRSDAQHLVQFEDGGNLLKIFGTDSNSISDAFIPTRIRLYNKWRQRSAKRMTSFQHGSRGVTAIDLRIAETVQGETINQRTA
jgi:hypothetical protein